MKLCYLMKNHLYIRETKNGQIDPFFLPKCLTNLKQHLKMINLNVQEKSISIREQSLVIFKRKT